MYLNGDGIRFVWGIHMGLKGISGVSQRTTGPAGNHWISWAYIRWEYISSKHGDIIIVVLNVWKWCAIDMVVI